MRVTSSQVESLFVATKNLIDVELPLEIQERIRIRSRDSVAIRYKSHA